MPTPVPVAAGSRLGPYEILTPLGAGGMGEVWKAKDTRLDRIVAIKILPTALAADAKFRQRFDREARAISALDHPHICALHDVGEQEGTAFLVMQYLEGETLEARLKKGALPPNQALTIAIQITDALDRAHRAGIVHRDLKPGNIMLTKAGAKLLDFGLAKTMAPAGAASALSMLPTTPPNLTAQGTLLGTFQYMAPEQLEGRDADARADIFAFGAVVHEMVTGKKAFQGRNQASLIGAILKDEPPLLSAVQPLTPPLVEHIVRRCLAKDPDERWQTASDVMRELKWVADASSGAGSSQVVAASRRPGINVGLAWALFATGIAGVAFGTQAYFRRAPADPHVYRATVLTTLASNPFGGGTLSLSPDGRRLAFIGPDANGNQLVYVRELDGLTTHPLAGTEGASAPFWSPDSRFLAFVADNKLKTIDVSGSSPALVLCETLSNLPGSWNQEGVILFTPTATSPLSRVSSAGGKPSPVTSVDTKAGEAAHAYPFFLPDGRHFLYLAQASGGAPNGVYTGSLDSTERIRLFDVGANVEYAQGALLFLRGTTLMAQPFDVSRLVFTGEPVPIADRVEVSEVSANLRTGTYSVSETGALVYRADVSGGSDLVWFDRAGHEVERLGDRAKYLDVGLSPDGARASVSVMEPGTATRDVWIYDVVRGLRNRLTFEPEDAVDAKWAPDGSRVAFGARRKGHLDLYVKSASGTDSEQLLLTDDVDKYPQSWSPDGRFLLYVTVGGATGQQELWVLPLGGPDRKPFPFLRTRFSTGAAQFSPDGQWILYRSNETGRFEIYVAPFPGPGGKWQVSKAGGNVPRWRRDGKETFYIGPGNRLMAAATTVGRTRIEVGPVKELFQLSPVTPRYFYDVSPDGQRFLVNTAAEPPTPVPLALVINWHALLKK